MCADSSIRILQRSNNLPKSANYLEYFEKSSHPMSIVNGGEYMGHGCGWPIYYAKYSADVRLNIIRDLKIELGLKSVHFKNTVA